MNYTIRGDKLVVTKAIKEYIEEKLGRLNKYYSDASSIDCKVLVRSKNNLQTIEVTIPLNKFILRAEVSDKDLYAAIDLWRNTRNGFWWWSRRGRRRENS